jgi:hypothetical protein
VLLAINVEAMDVYEGPMVIGSEFDSNEMNENVLPVQQYGWCRGVF